MTKRATTAFSYLRFSRKGKQAKGDSVRRQLEWGPTYCQHKGWVLDESLNLQDLGISAFRGINKTKGMLAAFRKAIKEKKVHRGDVLLIESLDRMTRENVHPAFKLFSSILDAGVEIVTREPERHYSKDDLNNLGTRIEVEAYFLRAYNESATKSMRGASWWTDRRDRGRENNSPIHQVTPAWLKLTADKKGWEIIPDAAEVIKLIYKLAGEGIGLNAITHRLNKEGIPPIGNNIRKKAFKTSWSRSYVSKLLTDKSVCGYYQPHKMELVPLLDDHGDPVLDDFGDPVVEVERVPQGDPIPNYFPVVIKEEEWFRVRQGVKGRTTARGRTGINIASVFTGLIRDARDGEAMHLVYYGSSRKNNTRQLVSYGTRKGLPGSERHPFPYDAVERAFLTLLRELTVADVTGTVKDDRKDEIAGLEGKLAYFNEQIEGINQKVLQGQGFDALLGMLEKLDKEKKETAAKLEKLNREQAHHVPTVLKDTQSLVNLLSSTSGEELLTLRLNIRAKIRQIVNEVWVLAWEASPAVRVAYVQVRLHSEKVKMITLIWVRKGKLKGSIVGGGCEMPDIEGRDLLDLSQYREDQWVRDKITTHNTAVAETVIPRLLDNYAAIRAIEDKDGVSPKPLVIEVRPESLVGR